jgi:hypothetical protein
MYICVGQSGIINVGNLKWAYNNAASTSWQNSAFLEKEVKVCK